MNSRMPFGKLDTNEVAALTNISRKQLGDYVKKGIVEPSCAGKSSRAGMTWSMPQVSMVGNVACLQGAGLSLEEIAKLANESPKTIDARLRALRMREVRQGRRRFKSLVLRDMELVDLDPIGTRSSQYLRYIPQRWMALIPLEIGGGLTSAHAHESRLVDLLGVAEVVGWATTDLYGAMASLDAAASSATHYQYVVLSSAPEPLSFGSVPDAGCYFSAGYDKTSCPRGGGLCEECSVFGRFPTNEENFRWNAVRRTNSTLWSRTVMADDLDEPYPTGAWSAYTKHYLAQARGGEGLGERAGDVDGVTVKPRMMPHEMRLPMGVTACVLPAGVYLCYQCDDSDYAFALQRMLGLASVIRRREFTLADELKASVDATATAGVVDGVNAARGDEPACYGDPEMRGWHRIVDQEDIRRLVLPTNMALAPEDGFCITCAAMPSLDRNDPVRYETQLLVDASDIAAPPPHCEAIVAACVLWEIVILRVFIVLHARRIGYGSFYLCVGVK